MPDITRDTGSAGYWERMNIRIFACSLVAALAGFIFGFDTVVISGAEQRIQQLWSLSPGEHGMAMASALYGTVLGSLVGGWPADRFGRKPTLIAVGLLYIVSAIGAGFAGDTYSFIAARLLGGLGIGISTVVAPLYISEIAPPHHRGFLAGMFQFNIVFGIVIAYISNALLASVGEDAWRWMLGIAAIPSLAYTLLCFAIPESPRWLLLERRNRSAGLAVLRLIQPRATVAQIERDVDEITASARDRASIDTFWSKSTRKPIVLAFLVAFFNQLSGINAVLYFAPRIFGLAGMAQKAALLQSVGVGVTFATCTLAGLWLIDRIGRRGLLLIGSWGYILSLGLIAEAFFSHHFSLIPLFLFAFVAAHALGQGTVIWVFISEIFPPTHRAQGQALGSFTHWSFAALITSIFPQAVARIDPGYIFLFFCGMMVVQLVWVKTAVPETQRVALEDMQRLMR